MKRSGVLVVFFVLPFFLPAQVSKPVQFREESFDFGNVIEEEGPVTHVFLFTNAGNKPLQILSVNPSCGCTTPGWSKEPIMPGKTGTIKAQFDPRGRPGYFSKSLTVTTDYDNNPIILQIKGTVSSKGKVVTSEFKAVSGSLLLKSLSFNFGRVYRRDEYVMREYEVINSGAKQVTYTGKFDGPDYIRIAVEPATIPPAGRGVIHVGYNALLNGRYGFQSDNIVLHTDDELQSGKSFNVYATLEDYFGDMKPDELAKAPRIQLPSLTVDFGAMKQNQPVTREVQVANAGKSTLEIRSLIGNCTCIQAVAGKKSLKPGETGSITITFNPQDRRGTQTKSVVVYSNDPQASVQRIMIAGVVE